VPLSPVAVGLMVSVAVVCPEYSVPETGLPFFFHV
jgi:hypothetical protein